MVDPRGQLVEDWQFTAIDIPPARRTELRGINARENLATDMNVTQTILNVWHEFLLSPV